MTLGVLRMFQHDDLQEAPAVTSYSHGMDEQVLSRHRCLVQEGES